MTLYSRGGVPKRVTGKGGTGFVDLFLDCFN